MASGEERESSGGEIKPVSACLYQKFDLHRLEADPRVRVIGTKNLPWRPPRDTEHLILLPGGNERIIGMRAVRFSSTKG